MSTINLRTWSLCLNEVDGDRL